MASRLRWAAPAVLLGLAVGISDTAPGPTGTRQHSAVETGAARRAADPPARSPAPPMQPAVALIDALPPPPIDADWRSFPLTAEDLDALASTGRLTLPDPQGGAFEVAVRAVSNRHGTRQLTVSIDGLPGQITRRGNRFFGTLATRRGVYAVAGAPSGTRIVAQGELDQRLLPGTPDYARAPGG